MAELVLPGANSKCAMLPRGRLARTLTSEPSGAVTVGSTDKWTVANEVTGDFGVVQPNAELTGAQRHGARAVRPMIDKGGCTARVPCRCASG